MSLTILFHNPQRPDEAGMTMITDRTMATAVMGQLERRGFVVDKISFAEPPRKPSQHSGKTPPAIFASIHK